ncbi:phage tail tape measure protein [Cohaesibacter sp. CAU 1516]|uniref:phage tail tape measure protein n=1 Tax=Cohaesibacter sp. CAU 1516 TaxID=2576038 RepID=UPI0010FF346E|nr:phage tail tape measure protein [Cohaesibacter sp. CAU 1516]TLP44820.1 phage tail tape measure protein [Cohaesibacter sp. CAU 1516]
MSAEVVETAVIEVEADLKSFTRDLNAAKKQADMLGDKVGDAMADALIGGRSLEQIFRNLALDVSKGFLTAGIAPLRELVSGGVSNLAQGFLSSLLGPSASQGIAGGMTPFATGGVVNGPTLFPMGAGAGLMGEAGPEAILPLQRGPDGRLGVSTGSGQSAAVSIVMNITTPDAHSFAKSENQIATKLARAVGRGRRGL